MLFEKGRNQILNNDSSESEKAILRIYTEQIGQDFKNELLSKNPDPLISIMQYFDKTSALKSKRDIDLS